MNHRVASVGYVVKVFYNNKIRTSNQEDAKFSPRLSTPLCAYTGDTTFAGLLRSGRAFFEVPILIMECTFMFGDRDKATNHQHIYVEDIVLHAGEFCDVQVLILTHIADSYSWKYVLQCVKELEFRCRKKLANFGNKKFPKIIPFGRHSFNTI